MSKGRMNASSTQLNLESSMIHGTLGQSETLKPCGSQREQGRDSHRFTVPKKMKGILQTANKRKHLDCHGNLVKFPPFKKRNRGSNTQGSKETTI